MTGAELAPLELAGRLALALGLAVFLGLAFEEVYKREERSTPGGVRTFPMLALSGAMLYLIEPRQALCVHCWLLRAGNLAACAFCAMPRPGQQPAQPDDPGLKSGRVPDRAGCSHTIALGGRCRLGDRRAPPGTREKLHRLILIVPQDELLTAGKFLILVGIILPTRSQPTGDGGNSSHALPRLVGSRCSLHAVLSELSIAKVSYLHGTLLCFPPFLAGSTHRQQPQLFLQSDNGKLALFAPTLQQGSWLQQRSCICVWA